MSDQNTPQQDPSDTEVRTSYTCPGELYSIPRSIHLARLAAFYPKCCDCQFRSDSGNVLPPVTERTRTIERCAPRLSLLNDESVRGVYLNELDRNRAVRWGEALAAYLWDQQPMIARRPTVDRSQIISGDVVDTSESAMRGPTVLVGFDERASSPDIATGAVLGLRRMGCPVIDLGQTSYPAFAFKVHELDTAAGLYVTGAGCDSSATGFDFVARGARPFPHDELLKIEAFVAAGVGRQTRQIGGHQPIHGQSRYETSLESHFHALRPLRVVCGTSTRMMPRLLDRLFSKLPCDLTHLPLPHRRRNLFDPRDADLQRIGTAVVEGQQHLGMIIDEDGCHTAFVTDRGRLVTVREVARLLIEFAQRQQLDAKFVVSTSWITDVRQWISGRDATAVDGGESTANLVRILIEQDAVLGLSSDGRIWFGHQYPTCDALLVLANVLQALSLSDAPFSEVVARISR